MAVAVGEDPQLPLTIALADLFDGTLLPAEHADVGLDPIIDLIGRRLRPEHRGGCQDEGQKVTHVHLIDSDGSLNEHNTSTHNPFGTGKLNFDKLIPAMQASGVPHSWWTIDLCFWPHAWEVTADSKKFLDKMRAKYAAA